MNGISYHFNVSNLDHLDQLKFTGDFDKVKDADKLKQAITETTKDILAKQADPVMDLLSDESPIVEIKFVFSPNGCLQVTTQGLDGKSHPLELLEPRAELLDLINRVGLETIASSPSVSPSAAEPKVYFEKLMSQETAALSFATRLFNFVGKLFTFQLYIRPSVTKVIEERIKNRTPEQLKELYINPKALFNEIDRFVSEKSGYRFLMREEMFDLVNQTLITFTNEKLKKSKESVWDEKTIKGLDTLRLMNRMKEGEFTSEHMVEKLSQLSPLEIPLNELADIPVTADNKEALAQIWEQVVGNLFAKGDLGKSIEVNNITGAITQLQYAKQYLAARRLIPPQLIPEPKLNSFCQDLDRIRTKEDIQTAVLAKSMYSPIMSKEEKRLYENYLLPIINQKVRSKCLSVEETHTRKLATALCNKEERGSILKDVLISAQGALEKHPEDMLLASKLNLLSPEKLDQFLISELETHAVMEGDYSNEQLAALREYRRIGEKGFELEKSIDSKLEVYTKEKKQIEEQIELRTELSDQEKNEVQEASLLKIQTEFLNDYKQLIKGHFSHAEMQKGPFLIHSLDALRSRTMEHGDLFFSIYMATFEHLSEMTNLSQINPSVQLDKALQEQLKPYLNAKQGLSQIHASNFFKKRIQDALSETEKKIPSEVIRQYICEESKLGSKVANDIIFRDDVIQEVAKGQTQFPLLSSVEQADLMFLTKVLDKVDMEAPYSLTNDEKQRIREIVQRFSLDPSFRKRAKVLTGEYEEFNFSSLLSTMPSFLHPMVKWYFSSQSEFPNMKGVQLPKGIDQRPLKLLSTFLSKTSKLKGFESATTKAEKLIEKVANQGKVEAVDKLTIGEIGQLYDLVRMNNQTILNDKKSKKPMELFETLGLFESGSAFEKLKTLMAKSKEAINVLEKEMTPALFEHYPSGCILGYSGELKSKWRGAKLHGEEYFTSLISNYGLTHGAKLFKNNDKLNISHIVGNYYQGEMSIYQLLISNIWEVDVAPLVNKEMQAQLKDLYEDDWRAVINKKYQDIENGIHVSLEKRNEKIKNSSEQRIQAGMANYAGAINVFAPKAILAHQTDMEQDFNKIHRQFLEGEDFEEVQICSEFVSKGTLAAMMELNRVLTKEIVERKYEKEELMKAEIRELVNKSQPTHSSELDDYLNGQRHYGVEARITAHAEKELRKILSSGGVKKIDIEMYIRLLNKEVFNLPYSSKEVMEMIHPGRMVTLLEEKKCVKKKDLPPKVLQYVQVA